ncbi:MAG: hypothetical protein JXQ96_18800 [Cyclobacteriaceae bacterium]
MKRLKFIVAMAALVCMLSLKAEAQVDQKTMDRDIEIAEDILMSMMKQDENVFYHLISNPQGMYVPDFGVIFNISGSATPIVMKFGDPGDFDFDFDFDFDDSFVVDVKEITKKAEIIAREAAEMAKKQHKIVIEERIIADELEEEAEELREEAEEMREQAEEMRKEAEEARKRVEKVEKVKKVERVKRRTRGEDFDIDIDDDEDVIPKVVTTQIIQKDKGGVDDFRNLMIEFLADYSNLIGQLKPDQKIMVSSGTNGHRHYGRSYYNGKLTAEISKKDLDDYQKEKISRDQLIEKIVFDETDDNKEPFKDLELFSTIFNRLYEHDLAETFYISRGISYERLNNFGVIYKMKVYSSKENGGKYSLPTQNLYDLSFEERNKKVDEMFPKFLQQLKENLLEYGKTIKSLNPNESILFQVGLTECEDCQMPRKIDVSVKRSTLSDYASGKLSKSAALGKVTVKKYSK